MAVDWLLADPFMQHASQELSGMTSLPPLVVDREKNDVSVVKIGKDRCWGREVSADSGRMVSNGSE